MKKYKSSKEWYEEIAKRESNGNYKIVNPQGYMGKYQMGEMALEDAGYYKKDNGKYNNDWSGKFLGKDNVYSKEDFLNNQLAQENAIRNHKKKQWSYLQHDGTTKAIGKIINGIPIDQSGLLAGAHLVGHGEAGKYIKSNGTYIPKDGNGVSIEEYIKKFGGYDVSEITDPNYYAPKFPKTKEEKFDQILNKTPNMIQNIANSVNPQNQTFSDDVINKMPIQPPLSEEEWLKRLKRKRMGIF